MADKYKGKKNGPTRMNAELQGLRYNGNNNVMNSNMHDKNTTLLKIQKQVFTFMSYRNTFKQKQKTPQNILRIFFQGGSFKLLYSSYLRFAWKKNI